MYVFAAMTLPKRRKTSMNDIIKTAEKRLRARANVQRAEDSIDRRDIAQMAIGLVRGADEPAVTQLALDVMTSNDAINCIDDPLASDGYFVSPSGMADVCRTLPLGAELWMRLYMRAALEYGHCASKGFDGGDGPDGINIRFAYTDEESGVALDILANERIETFHYPVSILTHQENKHTVCGLSMLALHQASVLNTRC